MGRKDPPVFDYNGLVARKFSMPIVSPPADTPGNCVKVLADGSTCGVEFLGPRNRKYCDAHSQSIKYTGRK